jgi:lipoyl(octanoyl) transferase
MTDLATALTVRTLGMQDYIPTWKAMQEFTQQRQQSTQDEIWLVEHPPVFTQGLAGKAEHILMAGDIPVVQVDRGGQVTYHGPGQLVVYFLIDLKRKNLGVRQLVTAIENSVISCLKKYAINSEAKADAPGVYVGQKKICSLGLKIKRGASFHGLALNVDMDLEPFKRINPCGYAGMKVSQISDYNSVNLQQVSKDLVEVIQQQLGYLYLSFEA